MIQKIKNILLSFSALFLLTVPLAAPVGVSALDDKISDQVCTGAQTLKIDQGVQKCQDTTAGGSATFNDVLTKIINIFSVIVGVVAVIMIIVGGFKYITSGGKEEGVKGAKNTILYALIGLIVVALAQIIVKFVLNKTTT